MEALCKFKKLLPELGSSSDLCDVFSTTIEGLGYAAFDAFSLKSGTIEEPVQECNFFVCDYGLKLPKSYLSDGWLQMDPVAARISRTLQPFEYIETLKSAQKNTSVVWQLGIMRLKKIKRAWIVPLCTIGHMRGMSIYMTKGGVRNEELFVQSRDQIHLLCIAFMESCIDILNKESSLENWYADDIDRDLLSQRETDCLHWAARGKTNREIGAVLGISENTVRYHLKNVFSKLHTTTRSAAVSRALSEGIVEL